MIDTYATHRTFRLLCQNDTPAGVDSSEYREYINGSWREQGLMVIGIDEEMDVDGATSESR